MRQGEEWCKWHCRQYVNNQLVMYVLPVTRSEQIFWMLRSALAITCQLELTHNRKSRTRDAWSDKRLQHRWIICPNDIVVYRAERTSE